MKGTSFERAGLGYVLRVPSIGTEIGVGRLVKSRGEVHGMLRIESSLPGVRSYGGTLFAARSNLSSDAARKQVAKSLGERAPGAGVDWLLLLEEFCTRVLTSELEGEPVVKVGALPRPVGISWRLDPILPASKPVVIYGEGGTGKSTLAVAFAVSVETGVAVIEGLIPRKANVLYLDWEADREEINDRVRGVAEGAGIPSTVTISYRGCAGPLVDQAEEIAAVVTADDIGLVVVDSVGLAAGTSSDGADAAESALRMFAAFRLISTSRPGCAVLAIDHVSKSETEATHRAARPYGSIYKVNLARAMFEVRRLPEEKEGTSTIGIYNTKSNLRSLLGPIALRLEYDEDGSIRYERLPDMPATQAEIDTADEIELVLRHGPQTARELAKKLSRRETVIRTTLNRHRPGKANPRFVNLGAAGWAVIEGGVDVSA